jgi:hypothetical protein
MIKKNFFILFEAVAMTLENFFFFFEEAVMKIQKKKKKFLEAAAIENFNKFFFLNFF